MISGSSRAVTGLHDPVADCICKNERGVGHSRSAGRTVYAVAAVTALTLLAALAVGVRPVAAQAIPKSLQPGDSERGIRETKNAWTVGIVGGLASGTYMRFAVELAGAAPGRGHSPILPDRPVRG